MWKPLISAAFAMGLTTVYPDAFFGPLLVGLVVIGLFLRHHALAAMALFVVLFCGFYSVHAYQIHKTPPHAQILKIQGHVVGLPVIKPRATRFDFTVDDGPLMGRSLRLSWYGAPQILPSEVYQLVVKIRQARNYGNPGHFDYVAYLQHHGIDAIGYVKQGNRQNNSALHKAWNPNLWRWQVGHYLKEHVPKSALGWVSALLIGDQSLLTPHQWQLLQQTGTVHLFVVSGLHIGLAAFLGVLFGRLLFVMLSPLQWVSLLSCRALGALVFGCTYALLAGFGVSVQRALVMLVVGLVGYLFGLRPKPVNVLLLALLWVSFGAIGWSKQAGLWFSFAAVAAIILVVSGRCGSERLLRPWLRVQWAVFWMLMPFLLFFGQSVSWLSPLLNMLLIPIVSFCVLPGLLLTVLLGWGMDFPMDGLWLIWGQLFQALETLLTQVAQYHWVMQPSGGSLWAMALAVFGACLLLLPGRLLRVAGVCAMLPLWFPLHAALPYGGLRVVFVDVGQGLAVWVSTQHHQLLFDTGDRYDTFVVADRVIIPWLYREGIHKLDRLVISHSDSDHAGGMASVVRRLHPTSVVTGYAQGSGNCRQTSPWSWEGVRFRFLALPEAMLHTGNEQSCVLLIEQDNLRVLLTGDIPRKVERLLLARFAEQLNVDVLQVPHHGSRTSSSTAFLQVLSPRWSVISSGFHNRFRHPHLNVVKRLEEAGSQVFNTATDGAVSIVALPEQAPHLTRYHRAP